MAFALVAVIDVPAARWVHDHPSPDLVKSILRLTRLPGHIGFTAALAVLIVWPLRHHWRLAATLLAAGAGASLVTAVLKWCLGRSRPYRGAAAFSWHPFGCSPFDARHTANLSFPSGDTTLAFATATVLALAFPRLGKFAFLWAVVVGLTRVLQGVHYPTDICGGALVGYAIAALFCHRFGTGLAPRAVAVAPLPT